MRKQRSLRLTPKRAKELVEGALTTRRLNKRRVEGYRQDMTSGRWVPGASSITLTESGQLVDGQHRLQAQHEAGITLSWPVLYVPDEDAARIASVIDSGQPRSPSQSVALLGLNGRPSRRASIARMLIMLSDGPQAVYYSGSQGPAVTRQKLLQAAATHLASNALELRDWTGIGHFARDQVCASIVSLMACAGRGGDEAAATLRRLLIEEPDSKLIRYLTENRGRSRLEVLDPLFRYIDRIMAGEQPQLVRSSRRRNLGYLPRWADRETVVRTAGGIFK